MTPRPGRRGGASSSFTLVELLVAVAVLALLLVFVAQLVSMTSRTTLNDGRKIDALSQARLALDRFGLDWSAHVARPDVAVLFSKNAGNDEIAFAAQMPSPGGERTLAVVDYRVNPAASPGNGAYRLERGIAGFDWTGGNGFPFPLTETNYPYAPAMAATNFQTLAPGVFRLEFGLLAKGGTNGPSAYWSPTNNPVTTVTNLAAVIVAVAALDESSRKLVDTAHLQALAGSLPDVAAADPAAAWQPALTNAAALAAATGVPLSVAQSVRVFERYFYVTVVP